MGVDKMRDQLYRCRRQSFNLSTVNSQQPTVNSQQSTTNNQQSTVNNQQRVEILQPIA
ncbi:MAG: hypothetical protein F6K31_15895 [Symploca sp. SIO2G7]|nr:hypothetical protein [Symploca sp. SIO2G7]